MNATGPSRSPLPGTLVMLLVVALVFVLRAKLPLAQWLGPARDWVGGFGAGGALALGLMIMISTAVGVPGSVSAIVAGLALGMWAGMLTAWLGITAGSGLCFFLSRWIFGGRLASLVERRPRLAAVQSAVRARGWRVLLLLRLTPLVPLVVTNYLAGVSGVRFVYAASATAVGIVPAILVYVGLGAAGSSEPRTSMLLVGIGVAATVGLGWVARRILGEVMGP